jgi:hypothetical protein
MRFVPQLVATLAMGAILGAMAAPVKKIDEMLPSDLQYADTRVERDSKH